jgi:hypothetical protein
MANLEQGAPDEPTYQELRDRINIARSVLGYAPAYRAVRKALAALDGATLDELAADQKVAQDPPAGEPREYLRGWNDGWDAGYTTAVQRHGSAA